MLALFIGLLLMLGMNAVFKATSDTVRAGQTLSEVTRNARAVQPVLFEDLKNCAADSPAFIISSSIVPQYLNAADATASNAQPGIPPMVTDPTTGLTHVQSGCLLGQHMHRCDMLMFFARGLFKRKTADSPYLASTTTSDEAYIHYGHLRIAKDGITPIGPDDYAGASEPYAADWVLGRNVILMSDANVLANNALDLGTPPSPEFYLQPTAPPTQWNAATNVTPLGYNSISTSNVKHPAQSIQSSRYDLAGTTIDQFRSIVTNAADVYVSPYFWWTPLVYAQPFSGVDGSAYAAYPEFPQNTPVGAATGANPQFATPPYNSPGFAQWFPRNRFQASNVLSPTPMTSTDQANLSPYCLEHVSQFIVEYAGDFTTQDANGNVTDTVPDGQIDWVYATKGDWYSTTPYSIGDYVIYRGNYYQAVASSTNGNPPVVGTRPSAGPTQGWSPSLVLTANPPPRATRWYGMPRDSTGSGHVRSGYSGGSLPSFVTTNQLNNVVPLADVWAKSASNNTRPLPYEVETIPSLLPAAATITDQLETLNSAPNNGDYGVGLSPTARYTAVWRNDVPAMVRILIKVDDPNNTVQDGPWYEYVFKLK